MKSNDRTSSYKDGITLKQKAEENEKYLSREKKITEQLQGGTLTKRFSLIDVEMELKLVSYKGCKNV